MPKFYESISPDLRDWALKQKARPRPAYVDATGSGGKTISHLQENGRITILFCSFDAAPRILRLFCTGSVIEWSDPAFKAFLTRMGEKDLVGARAIIRLDVFKVQTSCGYAVPQLSLSFDEETNAPKPYLKDRETLSYWARKTAESGNIRAYRSEWNSRSLDGLPGLPTALQDKGQSIYLAKLSNWIRYHRDGIEFLKTSALLLFVSMAVLQWAGYADFYAIH